MFFSRYFWKASLDTNDRSTNSVQAKFRVPSHMLNTIFGNANKDLKAVSVPSRYIVAKDVLTSPTRHPVDGILLGSDLVRRKKPTTNSIDLNKNNGDSNATKKNNLQSSDVVVEPTLPQGTRLNDRQPSDNAKAILERIPDLSYMLSPKLSIPTTLSTTN
jgi:hypothetical protein